MEWITVVLKLEQESDRHCVGKLGNVKGIVLMRERERDTLYDEPGQKRQTERSKRTNQIRPAKAYGGIPSQMSSAFLQVYPSPSFTIGP